MEKSTDQFTCFYCGKIKGSAESSDEHIVPTSIGGTRNATLTDQVCRDCNDYMSGHVDLPFARDWFIEGSRLLAGIVNKGKAPVHFLGYLEWDRSESISVFVTQKGVTIFEADTTPDGKKRLLLGMDAGNQEILAHTHAVVKKRFPGIPVANLDGPDQTDYDKELTKAVMDIGEALPLKFQLSLVAWHREIAKIALGLSCKYLGHKFTTSEDAERLRSFIFEDDPEAREQMRIPGAIGFGVGGVEPRITADWQPGGNRQLFALIGLPDSLAFVSNLFGSYESTMMVCGSTTYHEILPPGALPGVAWVVDGAEKTTDGPIPVQDLFDQSAVVSS